MLTVYSAVNFFAAAVMLSFAFIVYVGAKNEETVAYAIYSAFTGIWGVAIGLIIFFQQDQTDLVIYSIRLSYWAGLSAAIWFFYFSLIHRDDANKRRRAKWMLASLSALLFPWYLGTGTILKEVTFGTYVFERIPTYEWVGFILFNVVFTIFLSGGFWQLISKWRREDKPEEVKRTFYIIQCAVLAFTPAVVFAVTLPLLGNLRFFWIAPFITSMWVLAMTYGIARQKIFAPRVVASELLFIMMVVILFVNIFVPSGGNTLP